MNPETYAAELRDRPFGPVVERLEGLVLVDRRPEDELRRIVEHDGRRWVKVYDIEPEERDGRWFSYLLAYEGPEDLATGETGTDEEER